MGGLLVGAHYAASKAGLIGLTKSLAKLLAPDGVTANCVAPGNGLNRPHRRVVRRHAWRG